jgi:Na+/H+-dicarboxylate symporter
MLNFVRKFFLFLTNLPVQLVLSIALAIGLASSLSPHWICRFYTISTVFVDVLMIVLPFIVFIYIFSAIVGMESHSPLMVSLIFIAVTVSNALALLFAYGAGYLILPSLTLAKTTPCVPQMSSTIKSLFCIQGPIEIGTDKAMLAGIALGIIVTLMPATSRLRTWIHKVAFKGRDMVTLFLQKLFIPLLPAYVFGFSIKLAFEGGFDFLITVHAQVFLLSMAIVIVYLILLYFIAAKGHMGRTFQLIRTMVPAGLTGFSTMSSAATLPITLECTRHNLRDKHFPELIIPATANIHMLGDDLTIVLTAFGLLILNGQPLPELMTFLPFVGAFCIAKLSCVGIPGASVLVVLPVLQHYLGFTPEMISLLTTIYILQDPFGTCANVMGNGAFAVILHTLSKNILKKASTIIRRRTNGSKTSLN